MLQEKITFENKFQKLLKIFIPYLKDTSSQFIIEIKKAKFIRQFPNDQKTRTKFSASLKLGNNYLSK